MPTIRELIVQDVVAALEQISVANGYNSNLGSNIDRTEFDEQQLSDLPVAIVTSHEGVYDYGDVQSLATEEFGLTVVAFVDPPEEGWEQGIEAWGDRYLHDVQKALQVDPTRGGRAINTQFTRWEWLESDHREFGFVLFLDVRYRHSHEDPAA